MRENAERGFANGGKAPYGYRKVKITDSRGQEHMVYDLGDDDEIETVREIFDMAVNQGMGAKAIANALNSRKVRGPAGRDWQAATVWFLLSNQVYVGDLVWYKSKRVGRDGRARTEDDERVVFPNAHPAIIDRETFERRKALAAPRAFEERKSRAQRVNYLLARLIRCAHCGATYCGRRQRYKGKGGEPTDRVAYYCGGYLNKGPASCRSRPLPQSWLEGQVMAAIRARLGDAEKQAELRARLQARIDEQRRRYTFDSKTIKQKLAAIDQQVSRYFALIGEGWEVDRARAAIEDLKAKKARLEEEIVQVQQEEFHQKALHKNLELLERLSRILVHEFETVSFGVQRQVIAAFVDEIEVVDHERLVMRLVVPFDNGGLQLLVEQAEAAMRGDLIEEAENNEGESGLTRSSPSFYERPSEVPPEGLEPSTHGLRVRRSAS